VERETDGRGATAGGTWTARTARWLLAGTVLVGALVVATASATTADAGGCPVFPLVSCPGPTPPTTVPSTTTTTQPPTTTTTAPSAADARQRLLTLVNGERRRAGVGVLSERGDVTAIASRWSDSMAASQALSHDDAYFTKASHDRLDAALLGENVAKATDIDQAHRALMASEHHRDNILDQRFAAAGIGATYRDGWWWITEDFLQPRPAASAAAAPRPAPSSPAPHVGVERARSSAATSAPATKPAASVAASSTAAPSVALRRVLVLPRRDVAGDRPSALASERLVDPTVRLTVVVLAALLTAAALAMRWLLRRGAPPVPVAIAELGPAPTVEPVIDADAADDEVRDGGVLRRLAVIDAWVRTLDDRWQTLSEVDKRVAMQIIRRNTSAALDEAPDALSVSV
jgi:hypothetical protein